MVYAHLLYTTKKNKSIMVRLCFGSVGPPTCDPACVGRWASPPSLSFLLALLSPQSLSIDGRYHQASPGRAQSLSNLLAILPCGAAHAGRRSLTLQ